MKKTRVLIVDDSLTMRRLIRARLSEDRRIEVVGEATDAYDAREKIKALSPDVLTLDVEMPKMSGLEFLERLMRLRPMPVVMLSAETRQGSAAALEALSLGAVECIGKPGPGQLKAGFENLPDIIVMAAKAHLRGAAVRAPIEHPMENFHWNGHIALIGSSTGGVDALETVLSRFPERCPPTLIAQHMPEMFLTSFAARLNARIAPKLQLATPGAPLLPGHIYLAPGGETHLVIEPGEVAICKLLHAEKRSGHRPSVDQLFESAVPMAARCVAVQLTGMGRDGAEGMLALRRAGARCIAQDRETSVVFGMPKAALELGGAEKAVPLQWIARDILALTSASAPAAFARNAI